MEAIKPVGAAVLSPVLRITWNPNPKPGIIGISKSIPGLKVAVWQQNDKPKTQTFWKKFGAIFGAGFFSGFGPGFGNLQY